MSDLDKCPTCDVLGYECNSCRNARNSLGFTHSDDRAADLAADRYEDWLRGDR